MDGSCHFLDKKTRKSPVPPAALFQVPAMSFFDDDDGDHRRTKMTTTPPALDLLDEYWFFSNSLVVKKNKSGKISGGAKAKPRSPSQRQGGALGSGSRRLLRTPSLPPPRVSDQLVQEEQEVDDDDLNWSSIYEGVLRTRMAERNSSLIRSSPALHRAPSMPEEVATTNHKATPRLRHSYSTLDRHTQSTHQQAEQRASRRSFSGKQQPMVFQSSSDLESMEVQGFNKDLGFVFDKQELKSSSSNGRRHSAVPRPSLQSAAIRDARSAAEMKDQLRMWAQAVACNVRQEC